MPTARPIMTASTGVTEFTSTRAAATRIASIPVPTPMRALTMGAPAVVSDLKVPSSTMAAMRTPSSSVADRAMPVSSSRLSLVIEISPGS